MEYEIVTYEATTHALLIDSEAMDQDSGNCPRAESIDRVDTPGLEQNHP